MGVAFAAERVAHLLRRRRDAATAHAMRHERLALARCGCASAIARLVSYPDAIEVQVDGGLVRRFGPRSWRPNSDGLLSQLTQVARVLRCTTRWFRADDAGACRSEAAGPIGLQGPSSVPLHIDLSRVPDSRAPGISMPRSSAHIASLKQESHARFHGARASVTLGTGSSCVCC